MSRLMVLPLLGCGRQVLSSDFAKWAEEGRRIAEEVRSNKRNPTDHDGVPSTPDARMSSVCLQHVYVDVFSGDVNPTVPLTISPDYEDAAQVRGG